MGSAGRHRRGRLAGQPGAGLARLPHVAGRWPVTENLNMKTFLIGLLASAAVGMALAQTTTPLSHPLPSPSGPKPVVKAASAPNPAYREITWDDLVPKDWDPAKSFKEMNMGMLSDSDPRAIAALKRMRDTWDNAPTNNAMDETMVRIPGYIVPLEDGKTGMKEFLLVPTSAPASTRHHRRPTRSSTSSRSLRPRASIRWTRCGSAASSRRCAATR